MIQLNEVVEKEKVPIILGASLKNCVHIAGVANFLRIASAHGFHTELLGAAIPVDEIIRHVGKCDDKRIVLAVSYRLSIQSGRNVIHEFIRSVDQLPITPILLFGGTPDNVDIARKTNRFLATFVGDESTNYLIRILDILRDSEPVKEMIDQMQTITAPSETIDTLQVINDEGYYFPLLRHHFGLADLEETIHGIEVIAEAKVLDVISIAPDQNAQEFFFRPEQMDPNLDGAGGVPLRKPSDLRKLWKAAQHGNYPRLRIYSGTQDLLQWAEMSVREIDNAWLAVPLVWYSELDGRSKRTVAEAVRENQEVIKWYANKGRPVEILEGHQWSLRECPDSVAVTMAYIGAYNCKMLGVRQFISQFMFNTPSFTSPLYDLGKMMAQLKLIETLTDDTFKQYRQVRAGLSHFSSDMDMAKGQLAMSTSLMLGLRPHIIHIVSFTEGDHAAQPHEVIESCKIVKGVLKNALLGMADPLLDTRVVEISKQILDQVSWTLGAIKALGESMESPDAFLDPKVIALAIEIGILDAPHLKGQKLALGRVQTMPLEGGCKIVDLNSGSVIDERDRILELIEDHDKSLVNRLINEYVPEMDKRSLLV